MNFKQRLQNFMIGRYGSDELSRFYSIVAIILLVISMFTGIGIFWILAIVLLVYIYYRTFSRNISKMSAQNQKFRNLRYQLSVKKQQRVKMREQKKIYRFFVCPGCKQKVRVPKGRGKIVITCPKCRMEFVKKS